MLATCNLISCNFTKVALIKLRPKFPFQTQTRSIKFLPLLPQKSCSAVTNRFPFHNKGGPLICHSVMNSENSDKDKVLEGEGTQKEERDWTTSILLFVFWGAVICYVFFLTPDQTPSRDTYFLKKLLNLNEEDGFRMNQVLISLWYIMGLWPLVYSMLLLPTGRSSKSKVPVWPFLVLSCFGGAYALLPYFVLWRPPPPPVEETELDKWPLNFLDSRLTAGVSLAAGLGLVLYAGLANGADWREFYQYVRESKFIHITSLDFSLLSAFAPFWVYNDMTSRKWYDKGSWLLPISLVPFLGPLIYLVLRPSLSEMHVSESLISSGKK